MSKLLNPTGLSAACIRAHGQALIAKALGHSGSPGVVPIADPTTKHERAWQGRFALYIEPLDAEHRRLIGVAGAVAEVMSHTYDPDPDDLMVDLCDGWVELSPVEQKLAAGYTRVDIVKCIVVLQGHWDTVREAAAKEIYSLGGSNADA